MDNHKRNKLRDLRQHIAKLELEPPKATYRNVKKLERKRKQLVRYYMAKATENAA